MKPGRELDILVAEKVMGWVNHGELGYAPPETLPSREYFEKYLSPQFEVEPYSSQIHTAWEVVSALLKRGFDFNLSGVSPHQAGWVATFDQGQFGKFHARADVAEAICLAALKAVGEKV